MELKYANRLTDEELKEIYQLFLYEEDKIVSLNIFRYDEEICLEGKIQLPEYDKEYLDVNPYATIVVDNDYDLSDYNVTSYHHSGDCNSIYRKCMLEKFGKDYAVNYLLNR